VCGSGGARREGVRRRVIHGSVGRPSEVPVPGEFDNQVEAAGGWLGSMAHGTSLSRGRGKWRTTRRALRRVALGSVGQQVGVPVPVALAVWRGGRPRARSKTQQTKRQLTKRHERTAGEQRDEADEALDPDERMDTPLRSVTMRIGLYRASQLIPVLCRRWSEICGSASTAPSARPGKRPRLTDQQPACVTRRHEHAPDS
jgi:hypothetical protein